MIKNLLLLLGDDEQVERRTEAAFAVARRFGAHVIGLYPLVRSPAPNFAEISLADVAAREWARRHEAGRAAEKRFLAAAAAAGVSAEARLEEGEPASLLLEWGRAAELTVLSQAGPDGEPSAVEEVLLALGRPVLVVPYVSAFPTIGESVVLAWNGTRESARAAQAGLPHFAHARKVTVVGCELDARRREEARRLVANLSRHGIDAGLELMPAGDLSVGDVLLNAVADLGADLLVMGAYGHSRMREFVFGGATRTLLAQMTAPTLFVH